MKFSQTPNGKAIMYTIHEHGNGIGQIQMAQSLIKKKIDLGTLNNEFLLEMMEVISRGCKRSNEAVDFMYESLKADFEERKEDSK